MPDPFAHRYLWRRLAGRMVWRYPAPMTERKTDPIRPTDDDARDQARALIAQARFAALGVIDPRDGRADGDAHRAGAGAGWRAADADF